MITINLVFTRHKEEGSCNSKELLKIIEYIKPEVIFEELEKSVFDKIYKENKRITLESDAIKEYLKKFDIPHIPVDTFCRPLKFDEECEYLRNRVSGWASRDAFDYRNYVEYLSEVQENGFMYLNSDINDRLLEEIDIKKERVLNDIGDTNLNQISLLVKEVNDKREDEILNNIYSYCRENTFGHGLLLIGSGHRKSMLKKIEDRKIPEDLKLNWDLLNTKTTHE